MKWSHCHIYTLRDAPADAEIPSHQLLVRGGFVKKVAPGIFTYGFLGLRAIKKFEKIVREELDRRNCIEILMPMVHPRELWEETHRWQEMGEGLLKFKNRNGHEFCLGATHEEVITDYVRHELRSYRDLPKIIYQVQTKYRDEIRPRFGLMRGREFIMKDAYSFDVDREEALKSYALLFDAYNSIFNRLNVEFRSVEADTGNIGGDKSQEFQLLADVGEDSLMVCDTCDYAANVEIAPIVQVSISSLKSRVLNRKGSGAKLSEDSEAKWISKLEKFATPGQKTIVDLAKSTGLKTRDLVKTLFFSASEDPAKDLKPVAVLLRGSDEVNPIKLRKVLGLANPPLMLTDDEVHRVTGALPGSCGPVKLNIPIYVDESVAGHKDFIVGANEDGYHLKNVNFEDFESNVKNVADLRIAVKGDRCPNHPSCNGNLKSIRGIEVGHVFYLGTKYSEAMNAKFLDPQGKSVTIEMGCYGIGVSRTVQAVVEQCHDKDGIIWPVAIAPFAVHLAVLDPKDNAVYDIAHALYEGLKTRGVDVLMDDRDERPGVKFKDADLLGFPLRVTIGGRGIAEGIVEVTDRKTKASAKISIEGAVESLVSQLKEKGWS